ncbi:lysM domain receptor-like kinase 3 [Olea europaea subsp. europaea]|uniref:LysM domain receptor-like kinase 3 n=1 Tax=Olea europaea subsp. europaea TaxID=158383 RepID=A0A8S0PAW7_OLEEU|nr:lysM domain receptor-like kinase 3 [Olea europaea subsp. europaea]
MAPEFQRSGIVTQKFDVYAFGVVVLDLSSGMEAFRYRVDEETGAYVRISVMETAGEALAGGGGGIRKWVDRRLKDSFPVEAVEKLAALALECVVDNPDSLPDMGRVPTNSVESITAVSGAKTVASCDVRVIAVTFNCILVLQTFF